MPLFFRRGLRGVGKLRQHQVHEVRNTVAVHRRNRERIAQPQRMELRGDHRQHHPFGLVDDEPDFAACFAQLAADDPVLVRQAGARIHHEQHGVGLVHRLARLPRHLVVNAVLRHRLETAGVDHQIRLVADAAVTVMAVARNARRIGDDGVARAREPVEQRRLADIRPADYHDGGFHGRMRDEG